MLGSRSENIRISPVESHCLFIQYAFADIHKGPGVEWVPRTQSWVRVPVFGDRSLNRKKELQ